ncbi:MAG: hypothetical protein QOG99_2420 [Frankiales bacterium]|jgi:hypothetical protein|nr:hypothetical protein [Frankiales bacterium]
MTETELAAQRRALLDTEQVYVASDSPFQARLRLQQALWRRAKGLHTGQRPRTGEPLGSMLTNVDAAAGANYVDPPAVATALAGVHATALVDRRRLEGNLLSSQPLAFNLFATMAAEPGLETANRVFRHLFPRRMDTVTRITFEYSPERGDQLYLGNHSAFDVFVEYLSMDGTRGFLGIEVKYHEDLRNPTPSERKPRYDEVSSTAGCFAPGADLWRPPVWQLWLDHLLCLSILQAGKYDEGAFVFLAPAGNAPCRYAVQEYRSLLDHQSAFLDLSLENVLSSIVTYAEGTWVRHLWDRYGDLGPILATGWPPMH